jgi:hypothetical protein
LAVEKDGPVCRVNPLLAVWGAVLPVNPTGGMAYPRGLILTIFPETDDITVQVYQVGEFNL